MPRASCDVRGCAERPLLVLTNSLVSRQGWALTRAGQTRAGYYGNVRLCRRHARACGVDQLDHNDERAAQVIESMA